MGLILEFAKTRPDVIVPERANPSDAGLDLFFNPPNGEEVVIDPGRCALLQTGCRFGVPHGYMLEIKNRSGVAAKRSLLVGACVVDSGYDGEVFVNLHNVGVGPQTLKRGDKIAQAVLIPVVHFKAFEQMGDKPDLYDYYPITISNRGTGALGSTDKK